MSTNTKTQSAKLSLSKQTIKTLKTSTGLRAGVGTIIHTVCGPCAGQPPTVIHC
jgi:hypothetical protein